MNTESQPLPFDPNAEEPSFIRRRPVRIIIYVGLALFLLMAVIWPMIVQLGDPKFEKHIEQHRVMVGMSKEQVLQSWVGHRQSIRPSRMTGSGRKNGFSKIGRVQRSFAIAISILKRGSSLEDGMRERENVISATYLQRNLTHEFNRKPGV